MRAAPVASSAGGRPPADLSVGHLADHLADLAPLDFSELDQFEADDHLAAFAAFARSAAAICEGHRALRPARPARAGLAALCHKALADPPRTRPQARRFFTENFRPFRVMTRNRDAPEFGFVTGYFEPVVAGALVASAEFGVPLLARPDDLVTLAQGETVPGVDPGLNAAQRLPQGLYAPYPERAEIEAGAIAAHTRPIIWLRDCLEAFLVQVQGSARVVLPDGTMRRLVYAGRNGRPYSSLGRILVEMGEIPAQDMGIARLKEWIYAHGLQPGEAGAALMLRNKSYVFFRLEDDAAGCDGPIGGAGTRLLPLRSIAIDRSLWSYGLPFWISADLPWDGPAASPFRRLMIAQDTGSAIVGAARADLFFGTGDSAGARAGEIRHRCDFVVLLPLERDEEK
jgi:membrane-bound lytic murein transglycosylase A